MELKNDGKMMMTWMALRSHIVVYEWEIHLGTGAPGRRKGGGVNLSRRRKGDGVEWMLG